MKSFWQSPVDWDGFNRDYQRAMLMFLVVHVTYKDWGVSGGIVALALCALWAVYQAYSRHVESRERPTS